MSKTAPHTHGDDIFGFDESEATLFNQARSNCWMPHPTAAQKAGGAKVWMERVQVAGIKMERVDEMKNAQPGDVMGYVEYALICDLASVDLNGQASPNIGRRMTRRSYFNFSAFKRSPATTDGHSGMTQRSTRLFYSFVLASGIDIDGAKNIGKWIEEHQQEVLGMKFDAVLRQSEGQDGELQDEIQRFAKLDD